MGLHKMPVLNPRTNSGKPSVNSDNSRKIAKLVERLFSFYPPLDVGDPKAFLAGVVALMQHYPMDIVERVCDPARGLPSTNKYAPNLAEIRNALEVVAEPWRRQMEREAIARQAAKALPPPIQDRSKRKTYEQIVEECRAAGIMIGPKGKSGVDIGEFRNKHGISLEQWNAIPDAKRA